MKEYLQLFRDQAFNGAFALFKRILVSNVLITILLSIVGMLAIFPLFLKSIGWGIADIMNFNDKMKSMPKNPDSADEIISYLRNMFGELNYGLLAAAIVLVLIFSALQYVTFFTLNDNAVRNNNTNIFDAIKKSLSAKVFSMLGLYFTLTFIMAGAFLVYGLLLALLFMVSKILGVIAAFILFFVVILFIIRFLIAPAALVHGNMGIMASITYSYKKISWKRAGILFLMGLVFMIAAGLFSGLINSITAAIFGIGNTSVAVFTATQIISSTFGAVLSAFFYCALTAIYFRYSNDMMEDSGSLEEHLIN